MVSFSRFARQLLDQFMRLGRTNVIDHIAQQLFFAARSPDDLLDALFAKELNQIGGEFFGILNAPFL